MSNHRKFDDKIAEQRKKQQEGTAAFEAIMNDVKNAKVNQSNMKQPKTTKRISIANSGSLPNVSYITTMVESIAANSDSPIVSYLFIKPSRNGFDDQLHPRMHNEHNRTQRAESVGPGPLRTSKIIDSSKPYPCNTPNNHLLVPSTCRRAKSDPALNQSVQNSISYVNSPGSKRREYKNCPYELSLEHNRAQSVCNMCVPDITINLSPHDPNIVQVPIPSNTGSLPNLSQWPNSPLPDDSCGLPPYSDNSTQCSTPSNVSPSSVHSKTSGFSFGSTPPPQESPATSSYGSLSPTSPNSSTHLNVPNSNRYPTYYQESCVFPNNTTDILVKNFTNPFQHTHQPHQQSPGSPVQHQLPPQNQQHRNTCNITVQTSGGYAYSPHQQQNQVQHSLSQMPLSPQHSSHSQGLKHSSPAHDECSASGTVVYNYHHIDNANSYRTLQNTRPSPQPSPACIQTPYLNGGSANPSPLNSAPPSPTSSCSSSMSSMNPSPYSNYGLSQSPDGSLPHEFSQITMMDSPNSLNYVTPLPNGASASFYPDDITNDLVLDQQPLCSQTRINDGYTAPNTPSSLPDIVLEDFSNENGVENLFTPESIHIDFDQILGDGSLLGNPPDRSQNHFALDPL